MRNTTGGRLARGNIENMNTDGMTNGVSNRNTVGGGMIGNNQGNGQTGYPGGGGGNNAEVFSKLNEMKQKMYSVLGNPPSN